MNKPIVLIYKRTHTGDPDSNGVFGIRDCMGKVRNRKYDAVIGIGSKRPWKKDINIALRVNWIGINPAKYGVTKRGFRMIFSKFCLYDDKGLLVKDVAPTLYLHMYENPYRRVVMSSSLSLNAYSDVLKILELADNCPPSKKLDVSGYRNRNNCPIHC